MLLRTHFVSVVIDCRSLRQYVESGKGAESLIIRHVHDIAILVTGMELEQEH